MATRVDVRALRENLGLSREQFRKMLPVSNRTVRRWENGEVEPSQMALDKLARLQDDAPKDGPRRREATVIA